MLERFWDIVFNPEADDALLDYLSGSGVDPVVFANILLWDELSHNSRKYILRNLSGWPSGIPKEQQMLMADDSDLLYDLCFYHDLADEVFYKILLLSEESGTLLYNLASCKSLNQYRFQLLLECCKKNHEEDLPDFYRWVAEANPEVLTPEIVDEVLGRSDSYFLILRSELEPTEEQLLNFFRRVRHIEDDIDAARILQKKNCSERVLYELAEISPAARKVVLSNAFPELNRNLIGGVVDNNSDCSVDDLKFILNSF